MSKDYIRITILRATGLDIDGSSKPDLSCFIYCTAWGSNPQQTNVFKNSLKANFTSTFQIPIIDFKKDIITFKLKDVLKDQVLSSISIPVWRLPPGNGYKSLDLNPESFVKNGGKLEFEFEEKDDEYSDSTEEPIPPPLPLSEDSDPSYDNLIKMKEHDQKPSLISIPNHVDHCSNYGYYSDSYYSSNNNTTKKSSQPLPSSSKTEPIINGNTKKSSENQKQDDDEYSYYSVADSPKKQTNNSNAKDHYSDYEYYSTESIKQSPKSINVDSKLSVQSDLNSKLADSDLFCEYNYSSTESSIEIINTSENDLSIQNNAKDENSSSSPKKSDNSNSKDKINNVNATNSEELSNKNVLVNKKESNKSNKDLNLKERENLNENESPNREPKKLKSAVAIKRKKAASMTTATIKKGDAAKSPNQTKLKVKFEV